MADIPNLNDKVAVITGGQSGIGREIITLLLLHGISKVYVLARTKSKYEATKKDWIEQRGLQQEDIKQRAEFIQCDLSNVFSVKEASSTLLLKLDRLDMLYNNAGN